MSNKSTGNKGEDLAAAYLEEKGYRILERNYRFQHSELDIIAFEPFERYDAGGEIVFVEVKTRRSKAYGPPEEAITLAKQKSLTLAAEAFLYEKKLEYAACRFDVVSVLYEGGKPVITHHRHAFEGRG